MNFRLIAAPPAEPDKIADAFERIASQIQARCSCDRLAALQLAVDEHPAAFEEYLRAFGRISAARQRHVKAG